MSIYKEIDGMTKAQANVVAKYAQARVDALDKEKKEAVAMLDAACSGRDAIKFYGQNCYVTGGTYWPFGDCPQDGPKWEFELDNGSKIVIHMD